MSMLLENERVYRESGKIFCGVDEAGRGPLAGDVYAAAVILPEGFCPPGLNDSKKLSEKKREALYDIITANAVSWAVGTATAEEIDRINILNATYLAMNRAIEKLSPRPELCLIDGNRNEGIAFPAECVIDYVSLGKTIRFAPFAMDAIRERVRQYWSENGTA